MARKEFIALVVIVCFSLVTAVLPIVAASAQAAPKKEVIVIGGTPAAWVGSRVKDSLIADAIGRGTPYSTKIIGGLGVATVQRFGRLQDGKVDISRDMSGQYLVRVNLKRLDPGLAKRYEYLALWPDHWQPIPLIVYADLPFNSLTEAIRKKQGLKIGTGRAGSREMVGIIWKACGSVDGVKAVEKWGGKMEDTQSPPRLAPLLREGILNAYMAMGDTIYAALEGVHAVKPLKVVPAAQAQEELQRVKAVVQETDRYIMKPGHYSFVTKDTPTVGILKFWVGSPKLSDEAAYNITKAVWEARKYLGRGHIDLQAINPDVIRIGKRVGIKFHPGAERFYNDAGVWK